MTSSDLDRQMQDYGLTTAKIFYHLPDHPALLKEFLWQFHDIAPDFPALNQFLAFWRCEIEAGLHSVTVAHKTLIGPNEWRAVVGDYRLH